MGLYSPYKSLRDSVNSKPRRFDWGYGLEVVGNAGVQTQVVLPEAYAQLRWGPLELVAGRRKGIVGLVDTLLTSGSYAWSGNALPMPKIQIGTIGFVPLGFTKGLLAINAFYAHGWFPNQGVYVQHSYLHQKAFYLRVGKPTWKWHLFGGLNHQVQWGGQADQLGGGLSNQGALPSNLNAYWAVVFATRGTDQTTDPNVVSFDGDNRIGNHLGSVDLGVSWDLGRYNLFVYRQNLYETGSLFYLTSIADGLNGIRLRNTHPGTSWITLDNVLLEFFYSQSQGGPEFVLDDPQRRGKVNYFNHQQYRDGWQYQGHTIGTPFLTPQTDVRASLPVGYPIANNRVTLWHLGVSGRFAGRGQWFTKFSYSQNAGTYDIPYPAGTNQFSSVVSLSSPAQLPVLGQVHWSTSLAMDSGQLFDDALGVYIGLRKTFISSRTTPTQQTRLIKRSQ